MEIQLKMNAAHVIVTALTTAYLIAMKTGAALLWWIIAVPVWVDQLNYLLAIWIVQENGAVVQN